MGKKNKRSTKLLGSTSSVSCDNFISLKDEIILHLQLLKEAGGLVIGLNAVLRGLKNKSFCVVILISRKATSAMYHALDMMCRNTNVIFMKLEDISSIILHSKFPSSTAYAIKTSILTEQQKFEKLIEKINKTRDSQKFKKQRKMESLSSTSNNDTASNKNLSCAVNSECYENDGPAIDKLRLAPQNPSHRPESNYFIHTSHVKPIVKFSGNEDGFLTFKEIDFPSYNFKSNEISFCIK